MSRHLIATGLAIAFVVVGFTVAADDHRRGRERFRATLTASRNAGNVSTGGKVQGGTRYRGVGDGPQYELSYQGSRAGRRRTGQASHSQRISISALAPHPAAFLRFFAAARPRRRARRRVER